MSKIGRYYICSCGNGFVGWDSGDFCICPKCGEEAPSKYINSYRSYASNYVPLGAIAMEGVKTYKKGKVEILSTKRAVKEYEARNNVIMGSDDLEQEANRIKKRNENESYDKAADKAMNDIKRRVNQGKSAFR